MHNMKKFLATFSAMLLFAFSVAIAAPVHAQVDDPLGLSYGQASGLADTDIRVTVANTINILLGILGTISLVLIVYAGFLWMTAAGNDDQIGKAKSILSAAIIGLVIILTAYSLSNYVVKQLYEATQGQAYGTP